MKIKETHGALPDNTEALRGASYSRPGGRLFNLFMKTRTARLRLVMRRRPERALAYNDIEPQVCRGG